MSLTITSLASGSSGNAFLVQTGTAAVLVEAGLAARRLERHLRQRGVDPAGLSAIVVSHEHHDHVQGAGPLARRYGVPLVCSAGTATALAGEWKGLVIRPLSATGTTIDDMDVWGFPVPHDGAEPQAILLGHGGHTAGWALDLGHVPDDLAAVLAAADLLIIESNHDRELLMAAPYSWSVKHRILSERGHLSNLQAAEVLANIGADGRKRSVWLAHLSERANDRPAGVLRLARNYLAMAGITRLDLSIAERDRPSVTWQSQLAFLQQGALFDAV